MNSVSSFLTILGQIRFLWYFRSNQIPLVCIVRWPSSRDEFDSITVGGNWEASILQDSLNAVYILSVFYLQGSLEISI